MLFRSAPADAAGLSAWSSGAPLPEARAHAAVAFFAGKAYVIGGASDTSTATASVFVGTPDAATGLIGAWERLDALELPAARSGASIVVVGDGLVVLGGSGPDRAAIQAYATEKGVADAQEALAGARSRRMYYYAEAVGRRFAPTWDASRPPRPSFLGARALRGGNLLPQIVARMQADILATIPPDARGELAADIARERGLTLDLQGFNQCMAEQRERGRAASKFEADLSQVPDAGHFTEFSGYEFLEQTGTVAAIYQDGRNVTEVEEGEYCGVILDTTPFYAESGGQVGDRGRLAGPGFVFDVNDTQKQGKAHVHMGTVMKGNLKRGQQVMASVDQQLRQHTARNHSATHLLHAALRYVLGQHVVQKGSLVAPDRLRFDFSHPQPLTQEELHRIEWLVNLQILDNAPTEILIMSLDEALKSGAMSLFGEKYQDTVRVLKIGGSFSMELCGGTHVKRAGDIGLLKIIAEKIGRAHV